MVVDEQAHKMVTSKTLCGTTKCISRNCIMVVDQQAHNILSSNFVWAPGPTNECCRREQSVGITIDYDNKCLHRKHFVGARFHDNIIFVDVRSHKMFLMSIFCGNRSVGLPNLMSKHCVGVRK